MRVSVCHVVTTLGQCISPVSVSRCDDTRSFCPLACQYVTLGSFPVVCRTRWRPSIVSSILLDELVDKWRVLSEVLNELHAKV